MFNFPSGPTEGQEFTPPGGPTYVWESPTWTPKVGSGGGAVDAYTKAESDAKYVTSANIKATGVAAGLFPIDATQQLGGKLTLAIPTTAAASLHFPFNTDPTSPVVGDMWRAASGNMVIRTSLGTMTLAVLQAAQTWSAKQTFPAAVTGAASITLPHGTAPTTLSNGDLWSTTAGFFGRVNGATVGPFGAGGGGGTPGGADTQVQFNDASAFGGSSTLVWNKSTNFLTLTGQLTINMGSATSVLAAGVVEASSFTCTGVIAQFAPKSAGSVILRPNGPASATAQVAISTTNVTFSTPAILPAATTGGASLRAPPGVAPSAPTNGDVWTDATGIFVRVNGATVGPLVSYASGLTAGLAPNNAPIFTGKTTTEASAAVYAGFRVPHGTAPTTPIDGDFWSTSAGFFGRVSGVTIGPLAGQSTDLSTAEYTYNTTTTPPPASGNLRANNATQSAITQFYLHDNNAAGTDITNALTSIVAGDKILVQDKTNAANYARYTATGPAVDNTTYFTVPVAWVSGGSAFTAGRVIFAVFGLGTGGGGGGGGTAATTTFAPAGTIAATNVQAAIVEVAAEAAKLATISTSAPSGGVDGDVWYQVV